MNNFLQKAIPLSLILLLYFSCTSIPPALHYSTKKTEPNSSEGEEDINLKRFRVMELKIMDTKDRREELSKQKNELMVQQGEAVKKKNEFSQNQTAPGNQKLIWDLESQIELMKVQNDFIDTEINMKNNEMGMLIAELEFEKAKLIYSDADKNKPSEQNADQLKKYQGFYEDRKSDFESARGDFNKAEDKYNQLKNKPEGENNAKK